MLNALCRPNAVSGNDNACGICAFYCVEMVGAFCMKKQEEKEGYLYTDVRVMRVPPTNSEHFIHQMRIVL
jgi:hypothetical protein